MPFFLKSKSVQKLWFRKSWALGTHQWPKSMTVETALASVESLTAEAIPHLCSKQSDTVRDSHACALSTRTTELLATGFLGKVSMDHESKM